MEANFEAEEQQEEDVEDVMGDALNIRQKNTLPLYGNKETMNINPMILSNIQGSAYFKEDLYKLKTFHEVIDEIFYKVEHLEPWEKGSRKLAGQVGMCGGRLETLFSLPLWLKVYTCMFRLVRGVAAGGIVSSAYCLLYKLFTLKLTRRQLQAMLNHVDSPYIRGLGFMYIRYCQPPLDLWDWFEAYLDDPEEIDLKAGGGFKTTVGAVCRMMLLKLDWFGTMLPRISVAVSKTLEQKVKAASQPDRLMAGEEERVERENGETAEREREGERERERDRGKRDVWGEAARRARPDQPERRERRSPPRKRSRSRSRDRRDRRRRSRSREHRRKSRSRERGQSPRRHRSRSRSRERPRRQRSRSRSRERGRSPRRHSRSRSRECRRRSQSREKRRSRSRSKERRRSRSSSRDRKRR